MKKITTLLFILITVPFYAQWVQQNSGVDENLNDVYCITEDIVVVVGESGTILKTTDGGINWEQKNSGTTSTLIKVQFASPNVGYCISAEGTLFKTINGGENWNPILSSIGSSQNPFTPYGLSCVSENIFYITDYGSIKKTINGGESFVVLNSMADQYSENIQFLNEQVGFASNVNNLYKTTDGGDTWSIINNNTASFFFFTENIGFTDTSEGLYKTSNGGNSFTYLSTLDCTMNKLFATSENIFWGIPVECMLNGSPCYSTRVEVTGPDEIQRADGIPFKSIYFASETKGYAVSAFGSIYKNSTGNMLGVNEVDNKDSLKIYPNPSSNQITVSFGESPIQPFSIEIADCLGKVTYFKSYQAQNHININTANLARGLYFITILSQGKKQTKKLIIN